MKKIFFSALLVTVALSLTGLTIASGRLYWGLLYSKDGSGNVVVGLPSTSPTAPANISYNTANYNSGGVPLVVNQTPNSNPLYDSRLINSIDTLTTLLPDGYSINETYPGNNYFSDAGPDIYLPNGGTVYVHYATARQYDSDGNGINHSLGYFTWTGSPPTKLTAQEIIIFPNTSSPSTWATMRLGSGAFPAGTHVGFVIVANGWNLSPAATAKSPVRTATSYGDQTFYTLNALNPEAADENHLNQHAIMFWNSTPGFTLGGQPVSIGELVVGMEDTQRDFDPDQSDHDFNDILFTVDAEPATAIDVTGIPEIPDVDESDTDGDGVLNPYDDYPDDPERAFDQEEAWGTLAFEDNWPAKGDYDLNDLVLRYRRTLVANSSNLIKDIVLDAEIQARGATFDSGFAVEFTDLAPTWVETATLITDGGPEVTINSEQAPPAWRSYRFFDRGRDFDPSGAPYHFNTPAGVAELPGATFRLRVTLEMPQVAEFLPQTPHNPFLFRTGERGREVHLANHPPTTLVNASLFGTEDDASSPPIYYKTGAPQNLPWGLYIPETWSHPLEKVAISLAYGYFEAWAQSGGAVSEDWYLYPEAGQIFPNP